MELSRSLFLPALSLVSSGAAMSQCQNTFQWPQETVFPDQTGLITTINACNFLGEYSVISGIVAGEEYRFTVDSNAYITVRQGSFDGVVVGQGYSPVTVPATTDADLFPQWNLDETCATINGCYATTVQLLPDCEPPTAVVSTEVDCEANQFSLFVDVQALGDASSVGLAWTVNGGTPNSLGGLPVGEYVIGPFANFTDVDLVVEHAEVPACNVAFPDITSTPCVIEGCGPDTFNLCYGNNTEYVVTYAGDNGYPLRLEFLAGSMSQFGDVFTVYDGLDLSSPVLYTGIGNSGVLDGLTLTSTNPDHALTLRLAADGFFSCADGNGVPWVYTVSCLDCAPPQGEGGEVLTDCATQSYSVEVIVDSLGTSASLAITNDQGVAVTVVDSPGTYIAGPFSVGVPVELGLVGQQGQNCGTALGTFVNSYCPIQIACGEPAFEDAYCYSNNDSQHWLYENSGPESLALLFSAGSIESSTWDHLTIYDGSDNTAPVLFDHVSGVTVDLSGLLVISTGPAIYMEMTSDNIVSCGDGSQIDAWAWTVGCLDCVQPAASYEVVLDCENSAFYIRTTIDSLGTDPTVTITNTGGAPAIPVSAPGMYDSGPFALGTIVSVDVVSDENTLCSVGSQALTNAPCPLIGCGPFQFQLCYGDQMDTTIVYQGEGTNPIALLFNAGDIDAGDHIEVYDGPDLQSPLIYSGYNNGDLTGLLFTSSDPQNALCVRFISDFFGSCEDNVGSAPWDWSVSCLDCTNPEVGFEVVEDCLHHGFHVVANVTGLGTASDLRITDSWSGDTLSGVGLGSTTIGPIPVNTVVHLTVMNSANPLCRIISPEVTYTADDCIITACETISQEHCYENDETAWFVYQSGDNVPVTVSFAAGQLLDGDEIWIYNGLDQTAQLVFAGNLGGNVAGLALSSSNPDNALTVLVISDSTGSCATGEASPQLLWTVGCGLVGLDTQEVVRGLSIQPNPVGDQAHVVLAATAALSGTLELMDAQGRLVERWRIPAGAQMMDLGLSHLAPGPYRLRAWLGSETWDAPVVVWR